MANSNRMGMLFSKLDHLPSPARRRAKTMLFGAFVRFFRTGGLEIIELREGKAHIRMKNRKRVQNHIGTAHAAAMALLAESATGLAMGLSVPDDKVPVIKTLHVDYVKRATGDLEAVANLSQAELALIKTKDKGDIEVPVTVTDEKGIEPIKCKMVWAWTPKRKG